MIRMKQNAIKWIDGNKNALTDIAKKIWENPEGPLGEKYACDLHKKYLQSHGFKITESKSLPETAFAAEYGKGRPVLAVLGEYDALKNLSQAALAEKCPLEGNGFGHACGHNLIGAGCLGAAVAVKKLIENGGLKGTIRYYGCPAEEMLVGKTIMAQDGMFDGIDASLSWHPSSMTMPWAGSLLSLYSAIFTFKGKSAHAGASPHLGRSALDAVELMNTGANFMREHIEENNRVHYIITNGGLEPNTVPAEAAVWYNVRAPRKAVAEETFLWLTEIAKGAAMMTQTSLADVNIVSGCYEVLTNQTLVKVIAKNMEQIGGPDFTDEDREFSKKISAGYSDSQKEKGLTSNFVPLSYMDKHLHEGVESSHDRGKSLKASTDFGDVSWIAPAAMFGAAAWPLGVVAHTWQATAASGAPMGFHAMHYASKVLAASLIDLYNDPDILIKAKEEFRESTGGKKYIPVFDEKIVF